MTASDPITDSSRWTLLTDDEIRRIRMRSITDDPALRKAIAEADPPLEASSTAGQLSHPTSHAFKTNGLPIEACLTCGAAEDEHISAGQV